MIRFIKASLAAVVLGVLFVPGVSVAGDEVRTTSQLGDSRAEACALAKEQAASDTFLDHWTVVSIEKCDCGEESNGLWLCSVVYTVRTKD